MHYILYCTPQNICAVYLSGELLQVRRASAHRGPLAQSYVGQWVLPSLVGGPF